MSELFLCKDVRELAAINAINDFMVDLVMATGWYLDTRHYWAVMDCLLEQFDETRAVVFSSNKSIRNAFTDLSTATKSLFTLMQEAKGKCRQMWALALTEGSEELLARLGLKRRPNIEEINKLLDSESIYDFIEDDAWQYNMEYAFQAFATGIKNYLAYIRKGATK